MAKIQESPVQIVTAILDESLALKRRKNPSYSARALARDIGVSPSFLSMIRSGKKRLSMDKAIAISAQLELKGKKRNQFLRAIGISSLSKSEESDRLNEIMFEPLSSQEFITVEPDRFELFNRWYHVAILDLTTCEGFRPDIPWIAKKLRIEPALAADAIQRLLRLGLLTHNGSTLRKTNSEVSVPTTRSVAAIRAFHRQMIEKAQVALQSEEQKDYELREISGLTMTIDPRKMAEAKKRIALFKREMYELFASEGAATDVFQLNVQFFPLTEVTKPVGES